MKVLISNQAHKDIDSIFKYISRDSLKYANETSENIYSRISELEMLPYIGRYVPELEDKCYRELMYKNYRIIYSISDKKNTIYIRFVIHDKRNFKSFYKSSFLKNN